MLWILVVLAVVAAFCAGLGWGLPAIVALCLFLVGLGVVIGGHNAERARRAADGFQRDAGWLKSWLRSVWTKWRGGP